MNLAIISSSNSNYSETFIRAHKEKLKGNIFFYYGTPDECYLENYGSINKNSRNLLFKVKRKLYGKTYKWFYERLLIDSFKKNEIDVVLVEYGEVAYKFINPLKELDLPLIVHFHGRDATVKSIIEKSDNYLQVFKTADYVIVVSNKMYKDLLNLGCPESKLVYNVYGPREEFLRVLPKFSKPQFIAIGRFTNKKAPYYLILSFRQVIEQFPEAKLIIAGDGELWNSCKNLIKYYGLEENISLPGVISKDQYLAHLGESLAMIQHSVTAEDGDCEGTPVAVLEASAAGLPVISTKHAGIPDVIKDKETGLLIDEHDVEGMTIKMQELLGNESLARELGKKGKQNIAQNYTLDRHIKVLDELIKKTIRF